MSCQSMLADGSKQSQYSRSRTQLQLVSAFQEYIHVQPWTRKHCRMVPIHLWLLECQSGRIAYPLSVRRLLYCAANHPMELLKEHPMKLKDRTCKKLIRISGQKKSFISISMISKQCTFLQASHFRHTSRDNFFNIVSLFTPLLMAIFCNHLRLFFMHRNNFMECLSYNLLF